MNRLVINNNAKSNKLTDQVFWYKAEPRADYKIGAEPYWKYSQEHYSKEEVNREYVDKKRTQLQ